MLSSKILVIGAGGIGCEVLKALVFTGFKNLEIIDKDTIEVTNLNRQFLFKHQDVGKPKVEIAKQCMLEWDQGLNIAVHYSDILSSQFDVSFYKKFAITINALDNREARSHVNRMCLAADIPLVDGGTSGYLGQVTVIKKGETECYDCVPHAIPTTYPACTVRNTPSELIHCIIWAKHLFAQLFGHSNAETEVSPSIDSDEKTITTKEWFRQHNSDFKMLLIKLFIDDISHLIQMKQLWEAHTEPTALDNNLIMESKPSNIDIKKESFLLDSSKCSWNIVQCIEIFIKCTEELCKILEKTDSIDFEKDDNICMSFVASAALIRAHVFNIEKKSAFEIKTMAGNIIPAIVTTNDIIASLSVIEVVKILKGNLKNCKQIYLSSKPMLNRAIIVTQNLNKPNPKCYVCSYKPKAVVLLDCNKLTVKQLLDEIIKKGFGIAVPDVEIDDGLGSILISSDLSETIENYPKTLTFFNIKDGTVLKVENFISNFKLYLEIKHGDKTFDDPILFEIISEIPVRELSQLTITTGEKSENFPTNQDLDSSAVVSIKEDDEISEKTKKVVKKAPNLKSKKRKLQSGKKAMGKRRKYKKRL